MADGCAPAPRGDLVDAAVPLLAQGDFAAAIEMAKTALPDPASRDDATMVLAAIAFRTGQLATAIHLLETILDESAACSDAPELLAILNTLAGRHSTALGLAKLTAAIRSAGRARPLFGTALPTMADAFHNPPVKPLLARGRALLAEGATEDAIALVLQHLDLFPNDVDGLDAHSEALLQAGKPQEAIGALRSALTLGGPSAALYCRLGRCLTDLGEYEQARACHAEALNRAPRAPRVLAEMLLDLDRHDDSAHLLRAAAQAAYLRQPQTPEPAEALAPPAADKPKLCIGYLCRAVSGDLRAMVSRVAHAHDRRSVVTVGFGDGDLSRPRNAAFRGTFDRWIDAGQGAEASITALARAEDVDVLVDADGLLAPGRPHPFAQRAAPLQLSWLNLPEGIATPGADAILTDAPIPALLLARANPGNVHKHAGAVSFAADVTLPQLTPEVVRLWSAILHAVTDATLALYDRGLRTSESAARLIDLFGNFGVAHRVDVVAGQTVDTMFAECDVALAPFPAPAAASYGKALCLGVPVIALDRGPGRLLTHTIRHSGFAGARMAATTPATYVANACAWAADPAARRQARRDAPAIVATSATFNAHAFAAAIERHARDRLTPA